MPQHAGRRGMTDRSPTGDAMRGPVGVVLALALTSCASQPQGPTDAQIQSELAAVGRQDCATRFPTSPKHNHVAQEQCYVSFINSTIVPRLQSPAAPDLQALMNARRLALAEKVDQGLLTEADAESQLAETRAYAEGERNRRNDASAQTQAQMATARATQSQAISAATAPPPVVVVAQPPQCGILMGGRPQC
jgi:hypothetical protein